jgi:hypothetical protein
MCSLGAFAFLARFRVVVVAHELFDCIGLHVVLCDADVQSTRVSEEQKPKKKVPTH